MLGPILLVVALVLVIPISVLLSGGVASALLGWLLKDSADADHEGSELIDLNV